MRNTPVKFFYLPHLFNGEVEATGKLLLSINCGKPEELTKKQMLPSYVATLSFIKQLIA
jgi:hypothetical protein